MKAAFEVFLVLLLMMFFFLVTTSMLGVAISFNQAKIFQEHILSNIERNDGYDHSLNDTFNNDICDNCTFIVNEEDGRYRVDVLFPIKITPLKFDKNVKLSNYTYKIKQIE